MLKNATINGKKHWVISEEEYSVLVNLAATAGIMYAGKVDEKNYRGQLLKVRSFLRWLKSLSRLMIWIIEPTKMT